MTSGEPKWTAEARVAELELTADDCNRSTWVVLRADAIRIAEAHAAAAVAEVTRERDEACEAHRGYCEQVSEERDIARAQAADLEEDVERLEAKVRKAEARVAEMEAEVERLAASWERWSTPDEIGGRAFAQAREATFRDCARDLRAALAPKPTPTPPTTHD